MKVDIQDDLRQSFVIAKNEIRKFFSGKKIYLFSALMLLIMALLAIVPYAFGNGYENAITITVLFASFITFIVMLAGVLFTATSLVSEYEERTALILFTRPIRKWAIYVGKLIASMIVVVAYVAVYYVFTVAYSFGVTGHVEGNLAVSFGLCVCAVFAVSGVSMLLSSVAKKGSTASIMTLVALMLVFSIFAGVLAVANVDSSWIISTAMNSVNECIGTIDLNTGHIVASNVDVAYNAGVLLGWGIVCNAVAFYLFRKRDF